MNKELKNYIRQLKQYSHRLFGKLFAGFLIKTGVNVFTDLNIMSDPPRADIVLIKRNNLKWSEKQIKQLPDGIRQSTARHIILEFKYTQSINTWISLLAIADFLNLF